MKKTSFYLVLSVIFLTASSCAPIVATTKAPTVTETTPRPTEMAVPTGETAPAETAFPPTSTPEHTQTTNLELSTDLVNGCERNDDTDPNLREDDLAVDFSLMDINGNSYVLSDLLIEKPVALIYGSFT
jgi:hypothetical protein